MSALYRPIEAGDVPRLADFAIEGMRCERYPGMRVSRGKLEAIGLHVASSRGDFGRIAFDDTGAIVGGVIALATESLLFERHEAHVVLCRATAPDVGRQMLRELMEWAKADMRIRRVLWAMEVGGDPRIPVLAARLGFTDQAPLCAFYKT